MQLRSRTVISIYETGPVTKQEEDPPVVVEEQEDTPAVVVAEQQDNNDTLENFSEFMDIETSRKNRLNICSYPTFTRSEIQTAIQKVRKELIPYLKKLVINKTPDVVTLTTLTDVFNYLLKFAPYLVLLQDHPTLGIYRKTINKIASDWNDHLTEVCDSYYVLNNDNFPKIDLVNANSVALKLTVDTYRDRALARLFAKI